MSERTRRATRLTLCVECALTLSQPLGAQVRELRAVPQRTYDTDRAAVVEVRQVLVDAEDNVFVLDTESRGVHVFSPDGSYRGQIGRSGSGPGEFRSVGWMGWLGDTLWVTDPALRRINYFRRDGVFARIESEPRLWSSRTNMPFSIRAVLPNGCSLLVEAYTALKAAPLEALGQSVVRLCQGTSAVDTILSVNVRDRWLVVAWPTEPASQYQGPQPWSFADVWTLSPGGDAVAIAKQTPPPSEATGSFNVSLMRPVTGSVWSRAVAYRPIPLERAQVDTWMTGLLERLDRSLVSRAAARKAIGEALFRPAYRPPVTRILLTGDDNVWVQREASHDTCVWEGLDARGEPGSILRLPATAVVHEVRDSTAWVAGLDEFGVPFVTRFRLRSSAR